MLSMTTDYVTSTGPAEAYLRAIAEAGFSHVHWCHEWDTDTVYSDREIADVGRWLGEYGLKLNDLHGSAGRRKCWGSLLAYERLVGVDLVKNRIDMTGHTDNLNDIASCTTPRCTSDCGASAAAWRNVAASCEGYRLRSSAGRSRTAVMTASQGG